MTLDFSIVAASEAASGTSAGYGAFVMLVLFILGSVWIGVLANRVTREGSFMKGFFLGNRGLGAWALALTATVQSGGTFMGFPSLVYTHGWIVALWIGGYMVVPITGFGILGKRLAQLSRRTGAITVPDLFRARFGSPTLGLVASLFILLYLSFMMFAQFKAGAIVMKLAWPGSGVLAVSEDQEPFLLNAKSMELLAEDSVPSAVREKLAPLVGNGFRTSGEFKAAIKGALTANEFSEFGDRIAKRGEQLDRLYLTGLLIFAMTVVGYTLLGGFLAAVWTDLFQSLLMFVGVMILLFASLNQVGGLEQATRQSLAKTGPGYVFGPGFDPTSVAAGVESLSATTAGHQFLPLSMAISFFVVWVWSGVASPASLVRLMASQNTQVIRRSIYLLSVYNMGIYLPLIVICVCGRALIPSLSSTDEIIPRMAIMTTSGWTGGSLIAGLILAAPFGAVMSTVSSYLVVISSGLVRDIYQRFFRPQANPRELRIAAYATMIATGIVAVLANISPVQYLQALIVFSATGSAATFLIPALMACYWRRATVPGVLAGMVGGALTVLVLYLLGIYGPGLGWVTDQKIGQLTKFHPYFLFGVDPFVWGLAVSAVCAVSVCLMTAPPDKGLVSRMFDVVPHAGSAEATDFTANNNGSAQSAANEG
jgi:SSS family solute:Na+ symporter/sodium/pantothenate symporter